MAFSTKLTENLDEAYNTTGNLLLDILFMTDYYQNKLYDVPHIGESDKAKTFAMFIRDPRHGLGRRDLGRHLLHSTNASTQSIVQAGRYDDLLMFFKGEYRDEDVVRDIAHFLVNEARKGNHLAKKWMPRLGKKDDAVAKEICRIVGISQKEYRQIIKNEDTVEYKLSYHKAEELYYADGTLATTTDATHPLAGTIDYETVPSLAMIKYFQKFLRDDTERFEEYLEAVKSGEKKLNVTTTNVYDIYKNRDKIDADLFFNKLPKFEVHALPIVDTSSSMTWANDAFGKALALGHYIAKNSTFAKDYVVSFSSEPKLMKIDKNRPASRGGYWGGYAPSTADGSDYSKEIASLYTGDVSNTDLAKVMDKLSNLNEFPDFLVVLSDMEFDAGSSRSKDDTMRDFKKRGAQTKIVWWNLSSRDTTVPETDEYGNIYLSGYSPELLSYLETGFDGNEFLDKLLLEYIKKIKK